MRHDFPIELKSYFHKLDQRQEENLRCYKRLKESGCFNYDKNTTFAWVIKNSGLPWLPLNLKFLWEEILTEAESVKDSFVSHRTGGTRGYYDGNRGWSASVLHGISQCHTETFGTYGYQSEDETPYRWTDVLQRCPETKRFLQESYPCKEFYRVRFVKLAAGGYIYPHRDFAGVHNMLWYINVAVNNPADFHFRMNEFGYVPFRPGRAMMLNTSFEHGLINNDQEDRIHMIVHGMPLREVAFQNMVLESYKAVCDTPELFWKL